MRPFHTLVAQVIFPLSIAAIARPASAQARAGVRVGASVNPDQFYFGGHVETPPIGCASGQMSRSAWVTVSR